MQGVQVHSSFDVEEYAAAVIPFLEAEPCVRNVPRWIIELARRGTGGWSAPSRFWWFTDDVGVVGAASWSPPYSALVTSMPETAAAILVEELAAHARATGQVLTGVNGPLPLPRTLADAWSAITGASATDERLMYLHELRHVERVPQPPGERRPAAVADVETLAGWLAAFNEDVGYPAPHDPRAAMLGHIQHGVFEVWHLDGTPVSMAGNAVPLAGVVRVTTVYTPPEHRGRGYARRLVAEMSADALTLPGVDRCMLFTVAAAPVPNAIYAQIGYRRIAEFADIRFHAAVSGRSA